VGLGPLGDVAWDRSQQPPGDAAESDVADNQQVGMDLLGQLHQRVDGGTDDRALLDVPSARVLGPVAGLPQDLIYGGIPVHLVARAPEGVLGAEVTVIHTIRPWWS